MKASHQDYDHVRVITMSGEFTAEDADQFRRSAEDKRTAIRHVVLDCRELEFIDSAGLEACLRLQEKLGESGGQLRLVAPDETITKILEITRLDLAFEAHPTLESAVRSLR